MLPAWDPAALLTPEGALALATLSLLEIVLGVDNLLVLSLLVGRLPPPRQRAARRIGLTLAMLTRLALLLAIVALTQLRAPWFTLLGHPVSVRELVLGGGGALLLWQSVREIRTSLAEAAAPGTLRPVRSVSAVVAQIALIDVVFSIDSVFTAVGLARPEQVAIMAAAIVISIVVMMWTAAPVGALIERYPRLKVLALAFLALIGVALIGQAIGRELPKGCLYAALGFALAIELIHMRLRRVPPAPGGRPA